MKTLACLSLAAIAAATSARAAYTLDWSTMDAGGARGTAGSFEMQGTLGQPDVASGSAGSVVFSGGYWSLIDEPLPPLLRIFRVKDDIVLAWPDAWTGLKLQASPDLVEPKWTDIPIPPIVVGSEKQIIWGTATGRHFFRLQRP